MNPQRGATPIVYLIAVAVILGALTALYVVIDGRGYDRGQSEERAAWQIRENQELTAVNAELDAAHRAARESEQRHAANVAAVSTKYQQELADAKRKRDIDLAAIERGDIRLRDPHAGSQGSCDGGGATAGAGAGGRDARARGELSKTASSFLWNLAVEADEVVLQLQACQSIVRQDRALR